MNPVLIVVAGPNGAGKTTVTRRLRQDNWSEGVEYLNPDEVAQDRFGDWNSPDAVRAAVEWTAARREELLASQASIAFETVLSAPDKLEFISRARSAGYFVRGFFVGTGDPTINAARVARRYMEGGHSVPLEKIVSRYGRSLVNLQILVALAHRAYVFDNSVDGADALLCARFVDGFLRKIYGPMPEWLGSAVLGAARHSAFEDLRDARR